MLRLVCCAYAFLYAPLAEIGLESIKTKKGKNQRPAPQPSDFRYVGSDAKIAQLMILKYSFLASSPQKQMNMERENQ